MAEVIYAKYNRLRRRPFRICTVICEENGQRFVEKRALCPEAVEHVEQMILREAALRKIYPKVEFAKAEKTATGVRFPYLSGRTVDSLLTQEVKTEKDLKEAFEKVFEWLLPEHQGENAFGANIDCNLDNFLVEGDRIVCLDYEWVFDCEVPIDFLRYRVIHYYYGTHPETAGLLTESELLTCFGVSEERKLRLDEMEQQFQRYVFGEGQAARYTDNYRQQIIEPTGLIEWQKQEITELRKVVSHYQEVERKLRRVGLWQLLQNVQKIGRKIKAIIGK